MTGLEGLPLWLDAIFRAVTRSSVEGGLFALAIWAVTRADIDGRYIDKSEKILLIFP